MSNGLRDVLAIQGVTFPSTNVTSGATVGFEAKDSRDTMYAHITSATYVTKCYISLALSIDSKDITAAQAKTLPGVTADELITVICELYADSLSGSRSAGLDIDFYDDTGARISSTQIVISEAAEWEEKKQVIKVPTGATRINPYLRAQCGAGETVQAWIAHFKITRA